MRSLEDMKQELNDYDVCDLVDIFDISSEDIVERFDDKIEAWYDELEDPDEFSYYQD
jgi:hypothetical protein